MNKISVEGNKYQVLGKDIKVGIKTWHYGTGNVPLKRPEMLL